MLLQGHFFSQTLEMDTGLTVIAPNRRKKNKQYKTVYLLHGLCGSAASWVEYTMLPDYAQYYDMVFLMPEVARSFYTDMKYGLKYFSYIADELPEICRDTFNVSAAREDTVVIGGSMGGYGALKTAFARPDRFGACAALSSCCLFLQEGLADLRQGLKTGDFGNSTGAFDERIIADFKAAFGEELVWREENDILALIDRCREAARGAQRAQTAQTAQVAARSTEWAQVKGEKALPKLYLGCGSQDPFLADHQRFQAALQDRQVAFTFVESEGFHDWTYFNQALKRSLDWLVEQER